MLRPFIQLPGAPLLHPKNAPKRDNKRKKRLDVLSWRISGKSRCFVLSFNCQERLFCTHTQGNDQGLEEFGTFSHDTRK